MTCMLTREVVDGLLAGTLGAEQRAAIRSHLETPCDDCGSRLAELDPEALLLALVPRSTLSVAEQSKILEQARTRRPRAAVVPSQPRFAWRWPVLGFAGAAAAVLLYLAMPRSDPKAEWTGIKGHPTALTLTVQPMIATETSGVVEPWQPTRRLRGEEVVYFRFSLSVPAYVSFWESGRVLWVPDADDSPWPAGSSELTSGGHAVGVRAPALGARTSVLVVASPTPLRDQVAPTAEWLAHSCEACEVVVVELERE